jgi:hypothetical protein
VDIDSDWFWFPLEKKTLDCEPCEHMWTSTRWTPTKKDLQRTSTRVCFDLILCHIYPRYVTYHLAKSGSTQDVEFLVPMTSARSFFFEI